MKQLCYCLCIVLLFLSCKNERENTTIIGITNPADYAEYLAADQTKSYKSALKEQQFWSKRLGEDSTGVGDLGPLAGAYSKLFETSGKIAFLKDAETVYKKAIQIASPNIKDGYIRSLAKNYISQHRFKEATALLEESYKGVSNKHATELMLFDCYMEIGAYEKAETLLKKLENPSDYNYLIRISKWSDHKDQLDAAIRYMERAMKIAESRNNKLLKIWTYSNIADYYGHDGNIKASYEHYLKTLALQPDNAYAKKGIAWILYSKERNISEANRIIDTLMKHHEVPDYYLLKAEMAAYEDNNALEKKYTNQFLNVTANPMYGAMYNTYTIEALVALDPSKALLLAQEEVTHRATPETYHLLALAQLASGAEEEALQTIETFVADKTSEPMALLHSAMIYEANGMDKKVETLQTELAEASYEIGPILTEIAAGL